MTSYEWPHQPLGAEARGRLLIRALCQDRLGVGVDPWCRHWESDRGVVMGTVRGQPCMGSAQPHQCQAAKHGQGVRRITGGPHCLGQHHRSQCSTRAAQPAGDTAAHPSAPACRSQGSSRASGVRSEFGERRGGGEQEEPQAMLLQWQHGSRSHRPHAAGLTGCGYEAVMDDGPGRPAAPRPGPQCQPQAKAQPGASPPHPGPTQTPSTRQPVWAGSQEGPRVVRAAAQGGKTGRHESPVTRPTRAWVAVALSGHGAGAGACSPTPATRGLPLPRPAFLTPSRLPARPHLGTPSI